MNTRFKEVVNKLYHPPRTGERQVIALSRALAEKLPSLPAVAIISITAPDRRPADVAGFEHLLRLSFADVDFLSADLSLRAKQRAHQVFTVEHASQIYAFVQGLSDEIRTVVVHCEGGYSRSCAVAMALHERFGYVAEVERRREANPRMLKVFSKTPI